MAELTRSGCSVEALKVAPAIIASGASALRARVLELSSVGADLDIVDRSRARGEVPVGLVADWPVFMAERVPHRGLFKVIQPR